MKSLSSNGKGLAFSVFVPNVATMCTPTYEYSSSTHSWEETGGAVLGPIMKPGTIPAGMVRYTNWKSIRLPFSAMANRSRLWAIPGGWSETSSGLNSMFGKVNLYHQTPPSSLLDDATIIPEALMCDTNNYLRTKPRRVK